jgi:hypothetical protein
MIQNRLDYKWPRNWTSECHSYQGLRPLPWMSSDAAGTSRLGLTSSLYNVRQLLCRTSTMGKPDITRLLIIGAMTRIRWVLRNDTTKGYWLESMRGRNLGNDGASGEFYSSDRASTIPAASAWCEEEQGQ